MSRAELADAVNRYLFKLTRKTYELDRHQIARYERGEVRWPSAAYRAGLRAVLGAQSDEELGFVPRRKGPSLPAPRDETPKCPWYPANIVAAAEQMTTRDATLSRRQALASASVIAVGAALTKPLQHWLLPEAMPLRGTSGLSEAELAGWEQIAGQFRGWSSQPTAPLSRKAVIGQLNEISDRLRDAPDRPLTKRGFRIGGELAQIAGSMSWDTGLHQAAQRYYTLSVQFAKIADAPDLAALALASLARQCFDLGRPEDGLEIVQLAQYGTRRTAGPALRSLLATREAWAYSLCGRVQPFRRAVGLAEDHFHELEGDRAFRRVRGLDLAELHGVIGARYRDLALHDPRQARKAQEYIGRALTTRDPARGRNRAFDLIGLARAHLITAEPDRACELITRALPSASDWVTGRVGQKLRDFHRESEPFASAPVVRDTRDAVRELLIAT